MTFNFFKKEKQIEDEIRLDRRSCIQLLKQKLGNIKCSTTNTKKIELMLNQGEQNLNFYRYVSLFCDMKTVDADYVSLLNKYKDEIIKRCPGVIKSYLLDIIKEDADNYVEMHKKLLNLRINPKTKLKCIETNERSIFKLIWVYMGPMLHSSIWCPTEIKWYKESLKRKGLTEDSWWKQERMDYLNFLKSFKGNFKKFVGTFNVGNTEYSTMYKDPESLLQYFAFLSLDALRRNSNAINDIDNKFVSLIKQDTNFKRYFDYKLFMLRTLSMAGLFDVRAIFARDEDITFKNGQIFIKTIKPNFKNK